MDSMTGYDMLHSLSGKLARCELLCAWVFLLYSSAAHSSPQRCDRSVDIVIIGDGFAAAVAYQNLKDSDKSIEVIGMDKGSENNELNMWFRFGALGIGQRNFCIPPRNCITNKRIKQVDSTTEYEAEHWVRAKQVAKEIRDALPKYCSDYGTADRAQPGGVPSVDAYIRNGPVNKVTVNRTLRTYVVHYGSEHTVCANTAVIVATGLGAPRCFPEVPYRANRLYLTLLGERPSFASDTDFLATFKKEDYKNGNAFIWGIAATAAWVAEALLQGPLIPEQL